MVQLKQLQTTKKKQRTKYKIKITERTRMNTRTTHPLQTHITARAVLPSTRIQATIHLKHLICFTFEIRDGKVYTCIMKFL